jgi:catechol 2,3-dioxygenase-like lactoylglutathione lyase family enzyme
VLTGSKPELFVADAQAALRFYSALGFSVAHAKPDGYTTLRHGDAVLALCPVRRWLPARWLAWLRHPPLGTELVFYTDRLHELRAALLEHGYAPGTVRLQPWGHHDFRLTDPDGHYQRVSEGEAMPRSLS